MTHICVSIFVHDVAQAKRDMAAAAESGADMVELRIDHIGAEADFDLGELLRNAPIPCIVTCRPIWEGGHCELDEEHRMVRLAMAAEEGAAYVDIELKAVEALGLPGTLGEIVNSEPRDRRPGLIVSSHDFQSRPDRLYNIIRELNDGPADINKIVWTARSIRDNLEAFEILKTRQKPTIALCMGEAGLIGRVLAKKFGAFLSFAALDGSPGTASGQIAVSQMKRLYRWDAIGPATKVYGVVASPVAHSMSPAIHNAAFDFTGHDGVYLPLLVAPGYESFKAFMETFVPFDGLDLCGLSVTIPHKENALRYLQEKGAQIEPLAQTIGAVNTIIIGRETTPPTLRGVNTDYAAILDSITAALNISRENLAGRRIAIIGAGGTGRTAAAALAHYGSDLTIHNRTLDRADALAREFSGRSGKVTSAPMEGLIAAGNSAPDVVINTTSVGMYPNIDQSPVDHWPANWGKDVLVFDAVYNPMRTRLLAQAEAAGAKIISGVEMFVRQAASQFEAWTQRPAPADVMRRVIVGKLTR